MNTDAPAPTPRWAVAIFLGAVTLSGAGLWHQVSVPVTPDDDAAAAAAHVLAHHGPGDLVMISPSWDRGLWQALSQAPATLTLVKSDRVDPLDGASHGGVWVIGLHGRETHGPADLGVSTPAVETRAFGDAQVARFTLAEPVRVGRLSDAIADLQVSRRYRDAPHVPCPWRGGQHACGRDAWLDVRVETRDVFHRPAPWVYAHPGRPGETLDIIWPSPPEDARLLVLRAGITQAGVRRDAGSESTVDLFVGDTLRASLQVAPHVYALNRVAVPLDASVLPIRLEVRADDPAWRELMVEVDLLTEAPAGLDTWIAASPR